jgi:acetoin utilization protein AcuB
MNRAVVAIEADETIESATEIARATGTDHLLVLDEQTLVGILCTCDLEEAAAGEHVCDAMSLPVLTVRPDAAIEEAAVTMGECDIGCLPVAVGGLVLGTLGEAELARAGVDAPRAHCHHQHRRSRRAPVGH